MSKQIRGDKKKDKTFNKGIDKASALMKELKDKEFEKYRFYDNQTLDTYDSRIKEIRGLAKFFNKVHELTEKAHTVKAKQSAGGQKGSRRKK